MRILKLTAITLATGVMAVSFASSGAVAQSSSSYPWCLMTGHAQSCYYTSMAQCLASKRGNVDFCEPNNTYVGTAAARSSRMPQ